MNELRRKIIRVLELKEQIANMERDLKHFDRCIKEAEDEYAELMQDPYLADKVNGLREGGII